LNLYALYEALRIIDEEGLGQRFDRHCTQASTLRAGLEALGLCQLAARGCQVPSVVTALAPEGLSAQAIRRELLDELNLEISTGLGEYADRMWRIGVMGHSAQPANVLLVLSGLENALSRQGYVPPRKRNASSTGSRTEGSMS
jgi:alanine-glyoxylate transaminase/serine-glyoxylate transaminase/serine-pyruvate transaminase